MLPSENHSPQYPWYFGRYGGSRRACRRTGAAGRLRRREGIVHRQRGPVRRTRSERGTVVVESALALPLFLLLIFGTMEFGLAFRSYLTLANSTRDAARFSSTLGNDADADFQTINEAVSNLTG